MGLDFLERTHIIIKQAGRQAGRQAGKQASIAGRWDGLSLSAAHISQSRASPTGTDPPVAARFLLSAEVMP